MIKLLINQTIIYIIFANFTINNASAWRIDDVFSKLDINYTKPKSFHDQAADYYTLGGFSLRTKPSTFKPFSITPPALRMGCSGIDMYLGSFSLVSSKELVNLMQNLGSQAASYAFQLALKTFAPQMESLLSNLRNLSMELNQFAVEDCRLVQSAFTTALPQNTRLYEEVCKDNLQNSGLDYFKSRQACQDFEKSKNEAQKVQKNSNEELLTVGYNLFIVAAKKAGIPKEILEDTMSITGTIIVDEYGMNRFYESLVLDETTYNSHLKGGEASMYMCKDSYSKCLIIEKNNQVNIAYQDSYEGKVNKKLKSLQSKMMKNTDFSKEEIEFLSSLGEAFPVYNYLSLEVVTGTSIIDKSSELTAGYLMLHYLDNVIREIKMILNSIEGKQISGIQIVKFLDSLTKLQDIVRKKHINLMDKAYKIEKKAIHIERHFLAKIR